MKKNYLNLILSLLMVFSAVSIITAQKIESVWGITDLKGIESKDISFYKEVPKQSVFFNLDIEKLKNRLVNVPKRGFSNSNQGILINFPDVKGNMETFLVQEASVMEPELQNKFPEIRSFVGRNLNNPSSVIRFSLSPQKGFSGMILSGNKTVFIDPYTVDLNKYIVFTNSLEDNPRDPFICETEYAKSEINMSDEQFKSLLNADDGTLRTYRLALACTVEYAQFHGGTFGSVLAAMNTTMTRVNGVYERDLALTMVIVFNNQLVMFMGPNVNSDPYTNNDGGVMLSQNQATCDSNIGSANYDIGHVFSTGGGGIAQLNSPCSNGSKARGVTGSPAPVGDAFDIDYVAHEMGHQFGANHTQNNNCQRSNVSVEPGSASTIMGYAGICAPNVQFNSDDYFNGESIKEMWLNVSAGVSSACFTGSTTNNTAPNANAGSNFSVPKSTALVLRGAATDPDSPNSLTYCWEQVDPTPAQMPPLSTNTAGPAFRSLDPSTSPDRYLPPLSTVMSGSLATTWEVIPSVGRTMNFSLTVRDNEISGGATNSDEMSINVEDVTPFTVNTPPTWGQNTSQQVNWVVGSTSGATINCQSVNILFTTNNGGSFTTLASGVPNTGSAIITVPNIPDTNNAKILVEAADNIFYAVSDAFSISSDEDFTIVAITDSQETCFEESVSFDFELITTNGFSENTTFSASGVPSGATVSFSPTSLSSDGTFSLTLGNLTATNTGVYNITVTGTSASLTKSTQVVLDRSCTDTECSTYSTAQNLGVAIPDPSNGAPGVATHVLNVPDSNIIESVTLTLDVSHTWISDLQVYIIPPGAASLNDAVLLWNNECNVSSGSGYDDFNVTFDDNGSNFPGVDGCSNNFTGTYVPNEALSAFSGLDSQGDWELLVADFFNGDTGTINSWSLDICYQAPLSVEENSIEDLAIYPNPNNGEFNIGFSPKSGEDIEIQVYDIRGRAIFSKNYNTTSRFEEVISLNNAQSGVYLLTIADGSNKITRKIIVE